MTRPNWITLVPAVCLLAAAGVTPAAAQTKPRVEISAGAGVQTGASAFTESDSFPSNGGETATVSVEHSVKSAPLFEVGAAVRIAPQLWIGAQFAMANMKTGATVNAAIPHPILFNAPRTVQGSVDNVEHNEQNLHVDVMYALPLGGVDVKIMAGPTFFNLKQDFVSAVTVTETYPFDTAAFGSATTKRMSGSAVGFNAGADISHAFTPQFAVGGLVRYSTADVKFSDTTSGSHTVKAGGVEAAAGIRLRF